MGAAPVYLNPIADFRWALAAPSAFREVAKALEAPGCVLDGEGREACHAAMDAYLRRPGLGAQREAVEVLVDSYRADYIERAREGNWDAVTARFVGWSDRRRAVDTKISFLSAHALDFSRLGVIRWPYEKRPLPSFRDLEERVRCSYSDWSLEPASDLASLEECRGLLQLRIRPLSLSPHWRFAHRRWMHPYESVLHDFLHFGNAVLCLNSPKRVGCQVDLYDAADALLRGRDYVNLPCFGRFVSLKEAILEGTLGIHDFGTFIRQELRNTLSHPLYRGVYEDAVSIYAGLAVFLKDRPRTWWPDGTDWPHTRRSLDAALRTLDSLSV